jgi:bifunctional DNA-binding transcriptional regulator/antitoxin component of YhaV-PrlF toxin-antitoxin module
MRTLSRRARVATLVLPVLVVASAGCDIAMADFKQKQTAEWRKTYELQPGGRVEISNVNGKIDVEPASGNTVEVVAIKSARAASTEAAKEALDRIEIQETISPSDVRIQTRLQRGGLFSGGNLQVEYTVRVPAGADVKFSTVNGGIEIAGLKGHISVETVNGGVKAREIAGSIEASTTNGGVEVDLTQVAEPGVRLGCTNGGIRLRLPGDAKATISARITNGGIDASGLQLDTTESSRRRLDGRMNGGGTRVDIEGTNGGIRISTR